MTDHEITIAGFAYQPGELEIQPGDKVTWVNSDSSAHTATSQDGAPLEFDSGDLAQGDSFEFVFEGVSSGDEIPYICSHHGFMSGKITVA